MATPMPTASVLKRGVRVRFIGVALTRVPFGTEGVVTGQLGRRWVADFPVSGQVERVTLWRAELEVLPDDQPEVCQCGHTGADHCGETVLSVTTHRCVRCECLMYEPPAPRFEATVHDGVPTVRDNQTGQVVRHQGVWTEAKAAETARYLELTPGTARLLTWEAA